MRFVRLTVLRLQYPANGQCAVFPIPGLAFKMSSSLWRYRVLASSPIVFGLSPFAVNEATVVQPSQCRKHCSGIDLKSSVCDLLQALHDAVPMHRFERQCLENHEVQSSLRDVGFRHCCSPMRVSYETRFPLG